VKKKEKKEKTHKGKKKRAIKEVDSRKGDYRKERNMNSLI